MAHKLSHEATYKLNTVQVFNLTEVIPQFLKNSFNGVIMCPEHLIAALISEMLHDNMSRTD